MNEPSMWRHFAAPITVGSIFLVICGIMYFEGRETPQPPGPIRLSARSEEAVMVAPAEQIPPTQDTSAPPEPQPHFAPSTAMTNDDQLVYFFMRGPDRRWHIMAGIGQGPVAETPQLPDNITGKKKR